MSGYTADEWTSPAVDVDVVNVDGDEGWGGGGATAW